MPQQSLAFRVGDYISHPGSGVCKVLDICTRDTRPGDPPRTYYCLQPLYEAGSVIYSPTDTAPTMARKILSREEALALIQTAPQLDALWPDNENPQEEVYRSALRTNDCRQWVRIIKTLHLRSKTRTSSGKKVSQRDERYLHLAENLLYGELAVSLGMEREAVQPYIAEQMLPPESGMESCC